MAKDLSASLKSRIPTHADCVFAGDIFKVWQWPQQMYDGTTKVFEMIERMPTVDVYAVLENGEVAYCEQIQPHQSEPFMSPFGGRMDVAGESALEAAQRELLEEAGLVSDDWELVAVDTGHSKIQWLYSTFVARNCRKVSEQKLDGGERITIKTAPIDTFLTEVLPHPNFWGHTSKREILSGLNPAKVQEWIHKLKGTA